MFMVQIIDGHEYVGAFLDEKFVAKEKIKEGGRYNFKGTGTFEERDDSRKYRKIGIII